MERSGPGFMLTEKGKDRLQFFEVEGCGNTACPRCEGKKAEFFTCPTCGWKVPKKKALIQPAWDTWFFSREAGVYCPVCQVRIFTEAQARLAGISEANE